MSHDPAPADEDIPGAMRALDRNASRLRTPCGAGTMIWRLWGQGPPLVMLHGGSGSWMHWARNIEVFARTHTVIAPDMPGLGQSARPDRPELLASYAAPITRGLAQILGSKPTFDLVAFSFGSIVTGELLSDPDLQIGRLVLVGPSALGVAKLDGALVPVRHLHGAARRRANAENLRVLMFADVANIDDAAIDVQDWHARHSRTNSPVFARTASLREALARSGKRFSAISGERDATSQPPLVGPVLHALQSDAPYHILPGIGHWCMYEDAQGFNAALEDALRDP